MPRSSSHAPHEALFFLPYLIITLAGNIGTNITPNSQLFSIVLFHQFWHFFDEDVIIAFNVYVYWNVWKGFKNLLQERYTPFCCKSRPYIVALCDENK